MYTTALKGVEEVVQALNGHCTYVNQTAVSFFGGSFDLLLYELALLDSAATKGISSEAFELTFLSSMFKQKPFGGH